MSLPSILEDLQEVKLQFWDEMSRNNGFPAKSSVSHWFLQSSLVLLSGKLGQYDFTKLKPVAVAVELLDVAIREHYNKGEIKNTKPTKSDPSCFALVRGDYLYARALNLVSALGDCQVIKLLSQVIADISESNIDRVSVTGTPVRVTAVRFRKLASLYITSASLGAMLSRVEPFQARVLKDFSLNLGLFYEVEEAAKMHFFQTAKEKIHKLPQKQYQQMLEKLLEFS